MRLLLDTNAFIWWRANAARLRPSLHQIVFDAERVCISVVTAAEIAIKISVGKLRIPESVQVGIRDAGFDPLPFTFDHAEILANLPLHHRDPFDRMLIAQAQAERLTVVTADPWFAAYGVPVIAT